MYFHQDQISHLFKIFCIADMSLEWCQQPENGLPKPDLIFLLTISQEEMLLRPGFGNERYENVEFQKKVAHLYETVCDEDDNWVKIKAAGSIDEVHEELIRICLTKVKKEMPPLEALNFNTSNNKMKIKL